ncbi:leucine-rich PPR motif-containing protein, mitochondrial isoform X2 [Nematostella vectensis]|nr:leucine-rich PPR motif-containing protein, mitochondrial isoform X2 [Nematostella vectensis]XP_048576755.1 leucine-rich PPR motif-containing protein, mitochondrial isoform X2 [Nematostella vectensis]
MAALLRPGIVKSCRNIATLAYKCPVNYLRICQKVPLCYTPKPMSSSLSAVRYLSGLPPVESVNDAIDESENVTSSSYEHEAKTNRDRRDDRQKDRGRIGSNQYERILQKLGTITTRPSLVKIFEEILQREEQISNLQAYQVLRNCGKELIYETPEKRTELAHYFWDRLQNAGVNLDIMMYNALLSVYLQNGYKFNPLEVLERIQSSGLEPNLTTMALVIQGFGQNGDIQGVFKVLEFMKAADMPVTEPIYTSLILAYGKNRDMESAKGVFNLMRDNGMEPGIESYTSLLTMYAENGDLESIDETISEMQERRVYPTQAVYLSLIDTFSRCGQDDVIIKILEKPAVRRLIETDLQSLMLMLAGLGEVKSALAILDFLPPQPITSFTSNPQYILLRQIILSKQPTEAIIMAVNDLNTRGSMRDVFETALDLSFNIKRPETSVAIIREMLAKKVTVKKHYFYPMLAHYANTLDAKGSQEIFTLMSENNIDVDPISLSYSVQAFGQPKDADVNTFLEASKDVPLSPYLLKMMAQLVMETGDIDKLKSIFDRAEGLDIPDRMFEKTFVAAMKKSFDAHTCVQILKEMKSRGKTSLIAMSISDVLESCCRSRSGCKQGVKFLQLVLSENLQDLLDSRSYTSVMKHLNLHNLNEEFFELIRVMKQHRVPLDEHQYRQMIRIFAFIGESRAAQFCFDNYKKLVEPNGTIFSLLISAYGHSKDGGFFSGPLKYKNPRKVVDLYEEMTNLDLTPDNRSKSYIIMSYLALGKITEADAAKERFGGLGALTYRVQTQYLMYYAEKGDVENVERVMRELKSMENVHLSTYPYTLAMGVYKYHGDVESQRKLLDEMKAADLRPNGFTYGEMMRTHLFREDTDGALQILEEAKSNNAYPSLGSCIYLLNACAKTLSPERLEKVVMDMHTDITQGQFKGSPSVFAHALIYTCVSVDRNDLAARIMKETSNHNPQQYTVNATSAARRGESESIMKCIRFLNENGMDSTSLLIPLMRSYETTGDAKSALAAYEAFVANGGEPWIDLQRVLAHVLRKNGEPVPFQLPERSRRSQRGNNNEDMNAEEPEDNTYDVETGNQKHEGPKKLG